jgi:DNA-binding NarL/FixJ family response regulator
VTRVVIVADSGATMATLTAAVTAVRGAHIVRYGNSRTRLERMLAPVAADLVVIGDLHTAAAALPRLAEIARTAPAAKVVVIADRREVSWLPDALRARAAAVLPGNVDARVVAIVLEEVIAERTPAAAAPALMEETARGAVRLRRRRRSRGHHTEQVPEGQAA